MRFAFQTESDITGQWVDYYAAQAQTLAQQDERSIRGYIDREILNPDMQELLKEAAPKMMTLADDDPDMELVLDTAGITAKSAIGDWLRRTFGSMKKKVRRIFCDVVGELNKDGNINLKDIIKTVLLALIPAFTTGIPAAVLPVVVGLAALLLKYGYEHVCRLISIG